MPYYQFTVPSGGVTLKHKAEVAAAVTRVHGEVTGAPWGLRALFLRRSRAESKVSSTR